jgi:hypothetical protein
MAKKLLKYKQLISGIFLFSYAFLILLGVFHFHHVDIQDNSFRIAKEKNTESDPFDKLIDLTHECTVQQFASTVSNYTHITPLSLIKNIGEQDFVSKEYKKYLSILFDENNPLRAPPSQF